MPNGHMTMDNIAAARKINERMEKLGGALQLTRQALDTISERNKALESEAKAAQKSLHNQANHIKVLETQLSQGASEIHEICRRDNLGKIGDSIKLALVAGYEKQRVELGKRHQKIMDMKLERRDLRKDRDRLKALGDEFVWGEENPAEYQSEMTKLRTNADRTITRLEKELESERGLHQESKELQNRLVGENTIALTRCVQLQADSGYLESSHRKRVGELEAQIQQLGRGISVDELRDEWRNRCADLEAAFEPVRDWYDAGGEKDRTVVDMLRDAIADLQTDRKELLQLRRETEPRRSHVSASEVEP